MAMNGVHDLAVHAVLVPFPAQGHVNASIHLAHLLSSRGVFITFVNTEWIHNRMSASAKKMESHDDDDEVQHSKPNFHFVSFPDGLPPEHGRTTKLGELLRALSKRGEELEAHLRRSQTSPGVPPVTCIIADCCMCLQWLDKQRPRSVLYVSFGSLAVKSEEQLEELALGLQHSGYAFLWVLRADIAEGQSAVLPEGFEERVKDRALLVRWTPQLKVLGHPSIGGFLTHSGWNSTIESISMGVPMIGWPYFGDQFLNCRFAKDVWKVGLDFKEVDVDDARLVKREEIKSAVVNVMESEELRRKGGEVKEAARKAVMSGGSSFDNLTTFIHDMLKHAKAQSH